MNLLLMLGLAVGGIGAMVFLIGWVGRRVHDHPTCRGCKYDLSGIWPDGGAARCPECGREIAAGATVGRRKRGAVQRGLRVKRWVLVWVGLLLFSAGGGGSGVMFWPTLKGMAWDEFKPDWWLVMEADSVNGVLADRALELLLDRYEKGSLSAGNVATLVERGLAAQDDRSRTWLPRWGNLIEYAWFVDELTTEQKLQYSKDAASYTLVVQEFSAVGEAWKIAIRRQADRCSQPLQNVVSVGAAPPLDLRLWMWGAVEDIRIDGIPTKPMKGRWGSTIRGGGSGGMNFSLTATLEDIGEHTITLDVLAKPMVMTAASSARGFPVDLDTTELSFRVPLTVTFQIVADDEMVNRVVEDASLKSAMAQTIFTRFDQIERNSEGVLVLTGCIEVRKPPKAVGFEVFMRAADGTEWELVQLHDQAGIIKQHAFIRPIGGFKGGAVEIILRSSWEVAVRDPQIEEIWGGEIILPGIVLPTLPVAEVEQGDDVEDG